MITNCQVSEYPKMGPLIAQVKTIRKAIEKAVEVPDQIVIFDAIFSNIKFNFEAICYNV